MPQSTRQGWARRGALEKGGEAEARPGAEGQPRRRRGQAGVVGGGAGCSAGQAGRAKESYVLRFEKPSPAPPRGTRPACRWAWAQAFRPVQGGPGCGGGRRAGRGWPGTPRSRQGRVGEDRAAAVVQEVTERRLEGRLERRLEGPGALCPVAGRSPATARRPGRLSAGGPGCVAWCSCPHTSPDGRRVGSGARAVVPVRRDPPPGAWRGGARLLRRLRQEVERADMRGADDQEVAPIESGNLGRAESLCNGYDRRVDRPKWQVRVLGDERRRPP